MKLILHLITSCLLIPGLASQSALAQEQQKEFDQQSLRDRGPLSESQMLAIRQRQELIIDEVEKTSNNEWIGTYFLEDGPTSGAELQWAPENGFVVWWNTCSHGFRDKINFGNVTFRDGVLHLDPRLEGEGQKLYHVSHDLVPVKWGEQHFLVPSDQMIAFCYAVLNSRRSQEINEFFLKQSDREKRRFGLPEVPRAYKKYLSGNPIRGTIVELNSQPQPSERRFKLNVGRNDGVVARMKFFAISPRNVYMLVQVTEVTDNESEVFVITSGFKNGSLKSVRVKVGWKFTSRAPKRASDYYPG